VGRAFNERLKRLVDKNPNVRFAQTYPQVVMNPAALQPPQAAPLPDGTQQAPAPQSQPPLAKPDGA
jgi:small conductance mechanosensitive channel